MLDLIKKVLGGGGGEGAGRADDPELRVRLAACVILLEAVYADHEALDEELGHVLETMRAVFGISEEHARELLELAHEERRHAVDLWQFARQVNGQFGREDKLKVLESVWRILLADGELHRYEDGFARKITQLLRLSHADMIDAKLRASGR